MSNKRVGSGGLRTLLALALLASWPAGCGGDSSGTVVGSNEVACGKVCDKAAACSQTPSAVTCKQSCLASAGTKVCKNQQAIVAALDLCLSKDCACYLECVKTLPACEGGVAAD